MEDVSIEINGNLYLVSRTKRIECDMGINDVLVCARSENEAKGIALSLGLIWEGESKKDVEITKLHEVNPGDILLAG